MNINTEQILQEIDKVGRYVSEKLQVPIEKAFEILMKQVEFEYKWAIVLLILGIVILVVAIVGNVIYVINEWGYIDSIDVVTIVMVNLIPACAYIPLILINLYNILLIRTNPEWYMIQMILEKVQ